MVLYGLNYEIPELDFPLDLGNIRQLKQHTKAVSKIRFDVGSGYRLLEDVEINKPDERTIVDRKLPETTSRRKILTERILLLGVDHLLRNCMSGPPDFNCYWRGQNSQFEIQAHLPGGDLKGVAHFESAAVFSDRLKLVLAAKGALGRAHTRLVIANLDRMVAGADVDLKGAGYKEFKSGAILPSHGGDYLLFVNIHEGNCWMYQT